MTSNNEKKLLTKSDINKVFWRSFTVNASFNYERQMSQGAQYALSPILQKLYPDKKELGEALQRHAEFFNTTPMLCPFIFGITAAMEEENATQEDFDPNTINSVKAGLMGPLAGIGDSVFWGTLRPLAGGIACSLALTGNLFAPFLFLLLFNIPNVLVRYFGCHWGYNSGMKALNRFEELGLTEKIFTAAAIIGLLVIGGHVGLHGQHQPGRCHWQRRQRHQADRCHQRHHAQGALAAYHIGRLQAAQEGHEAQHDPAWHHRSQCAAHCHRYFLSRTFQDGDFIVKWKADGSVG